MTTMTALDALTGSAVSLASFALLLIGCLLPSIATRSVGAAGASLALAERLALAASVALALAVLVGQAGRIDPALGRLTAPVGVVVASFYAGCCVSRSARGVGFTQVSVAFGFGASAAFVAVLRTAGAATDWRLELAVVVGAALAVLVMHAAATMVARRKTA